MGKVNFATPGMESLALDIGNERDDDCDFREHSRNVLFALAAPGEMGGMEDNSAF